MPRVTQPERQSSDLNLAVAGESIFAATCRDCGMVTALTEDEASLNYFGPNPWMLVRPTENRDPRNGITLICYVY